MTRVRVRIAAATRDGIAPGLFSVFCLVCISERKVITASVMSQQMQSMQQEQQQQYQQMQQQQKYKRRRIKRKLKQMQLRRQDVQQSSSRVAPYLQGQRTQKSSISLTSRSADTHDVHKSISPMDIDSSKHSQAKGHLLTLPSSSRVEHKNSLSESVAYLRKTIRDPVNTIVQHQVKGNTAKMLVMCATGEQRLVTFDIPNEDCTVRDLLEQVHITFCSNTTVSLVDDPALGINYIVETGNAAVGSSYDNTDHSDSNSTQEIMSSSIEKNVDDQHTQKYLQNDNKKKSINILNDDCLKHIFKFLPILDRIRVEKVCRRWKTTSLESWHMVKVLDFSSSEWRSIKRRSICDCIFHKLLLRCGRFLTQLKLSDIYISLPDNALNTVGQLCPNLTNIDFNKIKFTASGIDALAKNCKNITRLAIGKSFHLDNELSNLFTHNNLEYLEINTNKLSGKCLTSLSAESLHTLILYQCNICEDYFCRALKRLGGLEKLVINECVGVDRWTLENIGQHCINLKVLDLTASFDVEFDLDTTTALHLTNLVKLEKITIAGILEILDREIVNMVLNCRQLIDVDIAGCENVTDHGLASIATLSKLERLNISDIFDITDEGLRHFRDLKVLECRCCSSITAKGLSMVLESSPQLRLLDISNCFHVDKHILKVAEEVCNRRASNVILKMIVGKSSSVIAERDVYSSSYSVTTNDNCSSGIEISPFLQIVGNVRYLLGKNYPTVFDVYSSDEYSLDEYF